MKVGGITSIVTAVTTIIGALVAFGVGISPKQSAALVAVVVAIASLAPLVSGWFTRSRVYAPATVARMLDDAAEDNAAAAAKERWPGPAHRLEP
jgi:hypothetical protein